MLQQKVAGRVLRGGKVLLYDETMPYQVAEKLKILEQKLDAVNKAVWSLRAFFTNPINFSDRELKQHWKKLKVTATDFQTAKKAVFDFDIQKFVTKQDVERWKK